MEVVYDFIADSVSGEAVLVDVVVDAVLEEVESIEVGVDVVPIVVEPVVVEVDAVPVEVEPWDKVVEPAAALSVVELFALFWVKPTLKPIVRATTANPSTPKTTNRLRRAYFMLAPAMFYNQWKIRVKSWDRKEHFNWINDRNLESIVCANKNKGKVWLTIGFL